VLVIHHYATPMGGMSAVEAAITGAAQTSRPPYPRVHERTHGTVTSQRGTAEAERKLTQLKGCRSSSHL